MGESTKGVADPIRLEGKRWDPLPDLGDDPSLNISGIACRIEPDGSRTCLVVYDEKRHAAFLTLRGKHFTDRRRIRLLDPDPSDDDDADLEAAAISGGYWWAFGSHSRKKKGTGDVVTKLRPSRRHLYRFPVGKVGPVDFALDTDDRADAVEVVSDLFDRLALPADLHARLEAPIPLREGGVNIEGGTVIDGRMVLGFRAASVAEPRTADGALVVVCEAEAVFGTGAIAAEVHDLRLGPGMGVRGLVPAGKSFAEGFLVLAGASLPDDHDDPAMTEKQPSTIWFWNGTSGAAPIRLGVLDDVPKDGKPEALLVLDADAAGWRILVLCDGVAGGAPAEYRVRVPPP